MRRTSVWPPRAVGFDTSTSRQWYGALLEFEEHLAFDFDRFNQAGHRVCFCSLQWRSARGDRHCPRLHARPVGARRGHMVAKLCRRASCLLFRIGAEKSGMPVALRSVDYKPEARPTRTVSPGAGTVPRADDFAAVEEFLHLLARAVRQFHTYPPTSPLCADADRGLPQGLRHARSARPPGRSRHAHRAHRRRRRPGHGHDRRARDSSAACTARTSRRSTSIAAPRCAISRASAPTSCRREGLAKTKTSLVELLTEHGVETDRAAHGAAARGARRRRAGRRSVCTLVETRAAAPRVGVRRQRAGQPPVSAGQGLGASRSGVAVRHRLARRSRGAGGRSRPTSPPSCCV